MAVKIKKVSYEFNPFKQLGVSVPKKNKEQALADVRDYVKEQMLSHIGDAKSPVKDGNWKSSLSKEYKKIKSEKSSVGKANLELSGEMLDALEVDMKSDKIVVQISGDQAGKADGNNRGTYGKDKPDPSKARNFIPQKGQEFNQKIQNGIKKILKDYED